MGADIAVVVEGEVGHELAVYDVPLNAVKGWSDAQDRIAALSANSQPRRGRDSRGAGR